MNDRDYEILYDLKEGEYDGKLVEGIRTVTVRAGRSLEIMCYPIVKRFPEAAKREAKRRRTSPAMAIVNHRNQERQIMRLMELNFTHMKAMFFTGTYEYPDMDDIGMMNPDDVWAEWMKRGLPEGVEDVRRHARNFLGKIRRRMKNPKALKWILRIEESTKEEALGLPTRYHIHMLIEAEGLNQDDISALWPFGFTRCDRFDLKHDGAAKLAHYIMKNKKGGRWVSHSRNLKQPEVRVSDRKVSRRRAMRVAEDVKRAGKEILEKVWDNKYELKGEPRVTYSDFLPGAYIYARMQKKPEKEGEAAWEAPRRNE